MTPGQTAVIQSMQNAGIEVNRANYIRVNCAGIDISNWTFEDEAELPPKLQDWSLFRYDRDTDQLIFASKHKDEAGNPFHRGGGRGGGQFTTSGQAGMAGERGGAAGKRHTAMKAAVAGGTARYSSILTFSHKLGKPELREARYQQLKRQGAKHPGKGYSKAAVQDEHGIIHTNDVHDVARALYEGKHVNLISADKVSVAIDHLGQVASRMAQMRPDAPRVFDLCKVTVEDSNLFCVDSKGIPRVKMPQLKGVPTAGSPAASMEASEKGEVDLGPAFREHLTKLGYGIEETEEVASHLKATQNELNGAKVAGLADAMRHGKVKEEQLLVSHDNYIVDGHHRWAAKVAIDYDDGRPGDVTQPVARVDAGIIELLALSLKFAKQMGLPTQGVGSMLKHPLVKDALEALGIALSDLNPDPDWQKGEHGWFTGSRPTAGNEMPQLEGEAHPDWQLGTHSKPGERDPAIYVTTGDEWNQKLSQKLAEDFDPTDFERLDREARALEGRMVKAVPGIWEELSEETRKRAEAHFIETTSSSILYKQWADWKQLNANQYIVNKLAEDFNNKAVKKLTKEDIYSKKFGQGGLWLYLPISKFKKEFPDAAWTDEDLIEAMTLVPSGDSMDIEWNEERLAQLAHKPGAQLTEDMRANIRGHIAEAAYIEAVGSKSIMDMPPEVEADLKKKADTAAHAQWDAKKPPQKFEHARLDYGLPEFITVPVEMPLFVDPMGPMVQGATANDLYYRQTQRLAGELSNDHAVKLMNERFAGGKARKQNAKIEHEWVQAHGNYNVFANRKLVGTAEMGALIFYQPTDPELKQTGYRTWMEMESDLAEAHAEAPATTVDPEKVRDLDNRLWRAWVGGSTTKEGQLLQYAISDELGGRFNKRTALTMQPTKLKKWADAKEYFDQQFGEDFGGYEGIKAYVRAKWETTQYLLEKAGIRELKLYRAIQRDWRGVEDRTEYVHNAMRFPDLPLQRNGAASSSTDSEVTNNWQDSQDRVVLRIRIPRTAALSIPAYGINAHNEHEVILIGTAWHEWDAWMGGAPTFEEIPMGTPPDPPDTRPPPNYEPVKLSPFEKAKFELNKKLHAMGIWADPTDEAVKAYMSSQKETLEGGLTHDEERIHAVTQDMRDIMVDADDPRVASIPMGSDWLLYPLPKNLPELPPLDRSGLDRSIMERKQRQAAAVAAHRSTKKET